MRIRVLCVSERQPDWVSQGFAEYARRLPRHLAPELVELPLARRRAEIDRARSDEALRLRAAAGKAGRMIALDERGQPWSSMDLSRRLGEWQQSGQDILLLIGGPDGLCPNLLAACAERWSLSPLTLPHGLVRVIIAEQLYRAHAILSGHPYHRA